MWTVYNARTQKRSTFATREAAEKKLASFKNTRNVFLIAPFDMHENDPVARHNARVEAERRSLSTPADDAFAFERARARARKAGAR
jgi:hypothetical protein